MGTRPPGETIIGYTPYTAKRPARGRNCYGTAFAIHPRWLGQLSDFVVDQTPYPGLTARLRFKDLTVCGIYLPPHETLEGCHRLILSVLPDELERPLLLIGDLNMRLGDRTGDTFKNPRGSGLPPWLEDKGLALLDSDHGVPTCWQGTQASSIVDYIWASPPTSQCALQVRTVHEDDVGGSDHRAVLVRLPMGAPPDQRRTQRRMIRTERLTEPGVSERYSAAVSAALAHHSLDPTDFLSGQAWVNALDKRITDSMHSAALLVLGEKSPRFTRARFVTEELREARRQRVRAFNAWRNTHLEEPRAQRYIEYQRARAFQHREVRASQHAVFTRFAKDMVLKQKGEQVRVLANMARSRRQIGGCGLKCDAEGLSRVESHFTRMFNSSTLPQDTIRSSMVSGPDEDGGPPPFTLDGIIELLRMTPRGKAPGRSGLKGELFNAAASTLAGPVLELFRAVWEWGACPRSWSVARIHPLFKKGARDDVANYRPISLTETLRKIFEKSIFPCLSQVAEPLDIRQGGFRRMRGTLEQVACLHDAVRHRATTTKGQVQMAFLDIKAAYDSVHRPILWEMLRKKGAPQHWVQVLCALFEHNVSRVAVNDKETGEVVHVSGLLQGSILSPTLYSVFIDDLPKRLAQLGRPGQGDTPVAAFLYADDIALVADNALHLQSMLRLCDEHAREFGYRFAPAKCVHLGALPGETVYLDSVPLPKSEVFPYLGITIGVRGIQYEAHAERVAVSFNKVLQLFRAFGLHGNGLALETCRHAYVTFL